MTLSWLSALNVKDRCIAVFKDEHVTIQIAKTPGCPLRAGIVLLMNSKVMCKFSSTYKCFYSR
jgi:hypothetical protein